MLVLITEPLNLFIMARLLFGSGMATGATGRMAAGVGGIVYQKNGRARTYVTPANPQTGDQLSVRAAFNAFNTQWADKLNRC